MMIETKRLLLRSFQQGDKAAFAQMATDGSLADIGFDREFASWSEAWSRETLAFALRDDPRQDYIPCTICRKGTGEILGSVGCSWYADLGETGITYFLGAQFRGNGYALEAIRAYVPAFFARYHASCLIATVREENTASWRALERAGFSLAAQRPYRDIGEACARRYRFYCAERQRSGE